MTDAAANERLRFTDEQIKQANGVNLLELAGKYGYELEDKERKAYHAKHSGGLYFYKDNNTFKHFGTNAKGGAINFIMMEENLSFVDAVKLLLGQAYEPAPREYVSQPEKKELVLPQKAINYKRAYWYLIECRGIDRGVVSAMMAEKKLYQGSVYVKEAKKYESVCVFVGYDETGKAKYCAMRGADPNSDIKRDKSGSDKGIPFHMAGRSSKVYIFESAVDAMSHAALAMLCGIDWRQDHRITTGCLSDLALQWFLKQHPEIKEICWCYDNDEDGLKPSFITEEEYDLAIASGDDSVFINELTGKAMKHIPCNWGQGTALNYARKYKALGYRVSVHTPEGKDFNADIISLRHCAAAREAYSEVEQENTADCYEIGS